MSLSENYLGVKLDSSDLKTRFGDHYDNHEKFAVLLSPYFFIHHIRLDPNKTKQFYDNPVFNQFTEMFNALHWSKPDDYRKLYDTFNNDMANYQEVNKTFIQLMKEYDKIFKGNLWMMMNSIIYNIKQNKFTKSFDVASGLKKIDDVYLKEIAYVNIVNIHGNLIMNHYLRNKHPGKYCQMQKRSEIKLMQKKIVESNLDAIIDNIDKLCINNKNDNFIIVPLRLTSDEGGKHAIHANMLLINKNSDVYEIERFEPHGGGETFYDQSIVDNYIKTKFEQKFKDKYKLKYFDASTMCPLGPQGLSGDAYCTAWSYYYAFLRLTNASRQDVWTYLTANPNKIGAQVINFMIWMDNYAKEHNIYGKIETLDLMTILVPEIKFSVFNIDFDIDKKITELATTYPFIKNDNFVEMAKKINKYLSTPKGRKYVLPKLDGIKDLATLYTDIEKYINTRGEYEIGEENRKLYGDVYDYALLREKTHEGAVKYLENQYPFTKITDPVITKRFPILIEISKILREFDPIKVKLKEFDKTTELSFTEKLFTNNLTQRFNSSMSEENNDKIDKVLGLFYNNENSGALQCVKKIKDKIGKFGYTYSTAFRNVHFKLVTELETSMTTALDNKFEDYEKLSSDIASVCATFNNIYKNLDKAIMESSDVAQALKKVNMVKEKYTNDLIADIEQADKILKGIDATNQTGGDSYSKYLKYKRKYLSLKN